jgi:hypothetical protein
LELHPFDQALTLHPDGADRFSGQCGRSYWNMLGPFGGVSAAIVLRAVLQHPALLGEPVSLTVNYASVLVEGPFTVCVRPVRTNRSTQHWMLELQQQEAGGKLGTALTATVLTAVRRTTWGASDIPCPEVPAPQGLGSLRRAFALEWFNRYEMASVCGGVPDAWDGAENQSGPDTASLTRVWMRDKPPRPLDFCSLTALADVFFPRVFLRRASRVPAGTVSMTVYFHAGGELLRQCGSGFVLGQARGQVYRNGFFDQTAQLWSEAGEPLATSTQVVYYKE